MTTNAFFEGRHAGEFLLSEDELGRSRDNILIAANQTVIPGMVLAGTDIVAGLTISQSYAGTGNGLMTLGSPAESVNAKNGKYQVECIAVAANLGTFRVQDPDGIELGNATVGVAFNGDVKFTIADGATDFVLGDKFTILVGVEASDIEYSPYAVGAGGPLAIALYGVVSPPAANAKISGITRSAQLKGPVLTWPAGITAIQLAAAIAQLAKQGLIVR